MNLEGWATRGGASPAPATPTAFRLKNVLFVGNPVRPQSSALPSPSVLGWFANASLTLAPSSPAMRCGLLPPLGACVVCENNAATGTFAGESRSPTARAN